MAKCSNVGGIGAGERAIGWLGTVLWEDLVLEGVGGLGGGEEAMGWLERGLWVAKYSTVTGEKDMVWLNRVLWLERGLWGG